MNEYINDPLYEIYLHETLEQIEQIEILLLKSEKEGMHCYIDELFRYVHTIKGSSAMMSLEYIAKLMHSLEDMFSFIRENPNREYKNDEICEITLKSTDYVKKVLCTINSGNPDIDFGEVTYYSNDIREYIKLLSNTKTEKIEKMLKVRVFFEEDCKMENIRAIGLIKSIENCCSVINTVPDRNSLEDDGSAQNIVNNGFVLIIKTDCDIETIKEKIGKTLFIKSISVEAVIEKLKEPKEIICVNTEELKSNYISVDSEKLDRLLNLVGELVTCISVIPENTKLSRITDELQDAVMSARMLPVSGVFHKMKRTIRELCRKTGKDVELVIKGETTNVDKIIVDMLSEPLMHIIRNSVDHGIENPEERINKNKNPEGKIILEATNNNNGVEISVFDDGRGLEKDKIIEKALKLGLITSPDITDEEVYMLITHPGFSTNENVTELSGRGVGMDVVKKCIQKAGGRLYIDSRKDKGTVITMEFPLTLTIIEGVNIHIADVIYVIPIANIREIFTADFRCISDICGKEMVRLRDKVIPLVRINRIFNINEDEKESAMICVVKTSKGDVCLLADYISSSQKFVVKPLPDYMLKRFPDTGYFAGCTITGQGTVELILNVNSFSEDCIHA